VVIFGFFKRLSRDTVVGDFTIRTISRLPTDSCRIPKRLSNLQMSAKLSDNLETAQCNFEIVHGNLETAQSSFEIVRVWRTLNLLQ